MKYQKPTLIISLVFLFFFACFDDDIDDNINNASLAEINEFIWRAMNQWYFWQSSVTDLADDRFANGDEFNEFLNDAENPFEFFNSLLFNEDRFSFFISDFNEFFSAQQGISRTNGLEFSLGTINGTSNVFGIVRYVLPGSNASNQDIQRGDIFTEVNGTPLTQSNFRELLFDGPDTFILNIAEVVDGDFIDTGEEVILTREVFTENPVFISDVIETTNRRVGYLMYNRFVADFDQELNNAFAEFVANDIDDLVLDLRYNPGGSVQSAIHLSSMITGQFNNQLLFTSVWNEKLQATLPDDVLNRNFTNQLSDGTSINSLQLNRVFIIAQGSTASASELVINSLESYIDVIHIGSTTTGKNEFSSTLVDTPECNFRRNCNNSPNPGHTVAIQPLFGRNANADGFFEFTDGLVPEIFLSEDLANYGTLGDINEPLLARALQEIGLNFSIELSDPVLPFSEFMTSSNLETPLRDNMYIDVE